VNGWNEEGYEIDDFEAEIFADEESEEELGDESELADEYGEGGEGPFGEDQEIELAAELLTVSDEAELDQFLGKLFRRVGKTARGVLGSAAGKQLKTLLHKAAKKAVPLAGRAVGTYFGGAKGGDLGARLAAQGGQIFGLELEGMSPEDQELQVARRYVRFAGDAARRAGRMGSHGDPHRVARTALAAAARRHAPGMLRRGGYGAAAGFASPGRSPVHGARRSGRWVRRGNAIVLFGA
jgi:hypothetical protein